MENDGKSMEGRLASSCVILLAAAVVVFSFSGSVRAAQGTWTDEFADGSRVQSSDGVTISGGEVRLRPEPLARLGYAFGASVGASSPSIARQGSTYFLYYVTGGYGSVSIGAATSPDALNWTDHGLVITPGFQGSADSMNVLYEDVLVIGSEFHMWYSGQSGATGLYSVMHATSPDGLNWTGAGVALSPEIVQGASQSAYAPAVLWTGSGYSMWYTTYNGANTWIRFADSTDGVVWNRQGIVMDPQAPDDSSGPRMPTVVRTTSDFAMWYSCSGATEPICRARSADGKSWVREGPVLQTDPDIPGESSGIAIPSALEAGSGLFRIWYAAEGLGTAGIYSALATDGYESPGYLTSVSIPLQANLTWLWLLVDKVEPAGTSVQVAITDGETGLPIGGYTALSASNVSLEGIDRHIHVSIQLNATLTSDSGANPQLDRWSVVYGTPASNPSTPTGFQVPLEIVAVLAVGGGALLGGGGYWLASRLQKGPSRPR